MNKLSLDMSKRQAVTALRVLYPLWALVGLFSLQYVPSAIVVYGDAAATAGNIVSNSFLYGLGIVGSLTTQLIHILVVFVLYKLFKSVSKNAAALVVILGLLGVPIAMLNDLNRIAPLLLLSGSEYLTAFDPAQLQSLSIFFLEMNLEGMVIAWLFWGLWLIPQGYLIKKSGYFPNIFGYLMVFAGLGYFLGTFVHFLLPNSEVLSSVLELLTFGEVLFMLWVILKGAKLFEKKK